MKNKELREKLEQYDDDLEVFMPIWKQQGIINGMSGTEDVYTNIDDDCVTILSLFIM
jgi:hypothetical protein